MEVISEEEVRQLIGNFYRINREKGKSFTVNHFQKQKFSRRTIYSIIKRVDDNVSMKRKPGSGRKPIEWSPKSKKRLNELTNGKVAKSYRSLGRHFKMKGETVKKQMEKMGIIRKKRIYAPKTSEKQKKEQRKRITKLRKNSLRASNGLDVIMDDESWYPFDYHKNNDYYYTTKRKKVKDSVFYKTKEKFPGKVMVWIAMSPKGCSEPFFLPKNKTMNKELFIEECIVKRLVPFIKKYYPNGGFIYWMDLASIHYATATLQKLRSLDIPFVPREENPPAAPQIRPIEDFWSYHKRLVYEEGFTANNEEELKVRFCEKLNGIQEEYFQRLLGRIKTKVRKAADFGLSSQLH